MTPLETARNRVSGNLDYPAKKAVYAQSDFQITWAIAEHYDIWDAAKIESRQRQLAKIATSSDAFTLKANLTKRITQALNKRLDRRRDSAERLAQIAREAVGKESQLIGVLPSRHSEKTGEDDWIALPKQNMLFWGKIVWYKLR